MPDLELILAEAMCGGSHRAPCRYHVAQAKIAAKALAGAGLVGVPREPTDDMVLAALCAPPDADVLERAARAYGFVEMPDLATLFPEQVRIIEGCARALQTYGDERAREARAATDRGAGAAFRTVGDEYNRGHSFSLTVQNELAAAIDAIRALTPKPGSETIEEVEWLRRLLRWCRPRLKHASYQSWLDQYLEKGPSPAPEDEPPIVGSEP